jgi:hypothetical protein
LFPFFSGDLMAFMDFWHLGLALFSTALFVLAIFFSLMLSRETKGEKYWFFFVITAFSMAVFHFVRHPWAFAFLFPTTIDLIQEIAEIVGAASLAFACFGLYISMKKIREKVGAEL